MTAVLTPRREQVVPAAPLGRHRLAVPAWWRDLVGSLTWLSLLIVTALWVAGGGLQQLGQLGTGLVAIGRLTGLWASDLMLIQVLMLARIPLIERVYGQDELARRHRWVGFASVNLMLAHIVATLLGYSVIDEVNLLRQTWDVVVTYPGVLLATAGTAMLLLVAVTSMKRARARLRYESWHLLHLYAYLGTGLALPHQLWTGADFVSSGWARAYWWTLYGATLAAVLIWRVGVPLWRSARHGLTVDRVVPEGPGVVSVHLRGRNLHRLASAGQFLTWRFLGRPGWTRGNPYSLSAAPTRSRMRITVKDLGDNSASLATLRPGTKVLIEGPYGRLHGGVRTRRKVTLIGSGIGITPLRALLEELEGEPGDITLIYRASTPQDLVLRDELDELAARRGARVIYAVGPRIGTRPSWLPVSAAHLSDAQALRELVPDIADNDVYLCGAQPWMEAAAAAARECGVPRQNIHLERFSW